NDTTIQGAQLKGQQVVANIGNNLTIRSEQDTDDFASKTMQAGGKVMVGITQSGFVSGSAYFAQSKVDSHYSSVNEVSGIKAGAGGFQLDVGGTTHLVGGKIASDADASKNLLSTGNLVYEDLHNESKYKASQISFSGGSTIASNVAGAIGTAISAATPQHGNASSDTRSGIAEGTIVVRNDPGKDLSGLDRKPTLEDEALKNAYDAKKVADRQELTAQAGYVGMRGVGDLSKWMADNAKTDQDREAWSDGGRNKVILHGVVGAAMASLGGGNAAEGALGGASSEAVSHVMQQYLYDHNVQPGSSEWNTYMELGSAIVGGVTGRGNGANAALAGEIYNRQLHQTEEDRIQTLAGGDKEKQARLAAAACALVHCSAEYATDSPEFEQFSKLEQLGSREEYAAERDLLRSQTYQRMGITADGKATPVTEYLFDHDVSDRLLDGIGWLNNSYGHPITRAGGVVQAVGGAGTVVSGGVLAVGGAAACPESLGAGCGAALLGTVAVGYGADHVRAGLLTTFGPGTQANTYGGELIAQKFGISPGAAELLYGTLGMAGSFRVATAFDSLGEISAAKRSADLASPYRINPEVMAEGRVGGEVFTDVNQRARPLNQADPNQATLIADRVGEKAAANPNKVFPNGNMATAHAEIGVIQQAYNAGKTVGADMSMNVNGLVVCGFCVGDIAAAAERAGLKSLSVYAVDGKSGVSIQYYWTPVSAYSSRKGYLGLGIEPAPEVGPYDDGDHHVRTLARMNNGGGEVDILGDYWQRDYVTRDVGVGATHQVEKGNAMILGGFYIDDVIGRVQLPVIRDPKEADIDVVIPTYVGRTGSLVLRVMPAPEVGPYELTFDSEDGNFFLMLNAYLDDGDHGVRTLAKMDNGGDQVDIFGNFWSRDYVTRDVGIVCLCFKEFLLHQNIHLPVFEVE
ncbi:hypothetical protein KCV01_g3350, partial [Aureobasidium melanogenum]